MEAVGDIENSANEMNGIENSESDNNKDSSEGDGGGSSVGGIAPPGAGTGDQAGAAATALQNEITEAAVSGKRHVTLGGLCFARIIAHTYIFIHYIFAMHASSFYHCEDDEVVPVVKTTCLHRAKRF